MGRPIADLEGGEDTIVLPLVDNSNETAKIHVPSLSMQVGLRMYHFPTVMRGDRLASLQLDQFRDFLRRGVPVFVGCAMFGDTMLIFLQNACDGNGVIRMRPAKPDLRAHFD